MKETVTFLQALNATRLAEDPLGCFIGAGNRHEREWAKRGPFSLMSVPCS